MNKYFFPAVFVFLLSCNLFGYSTPAEQNCSIGNIAYSKFYVVSLDSVKSLNNTNEFKNQFSESFLVDAANQLLMHHLSQYQNIITKTDDSLLANLSVSSLMNFLTANNDSATTDTATIIRAIAQKSGAEFVAIPCSCSLQLIVFKQNNWRDGRGGTSYRRPEKKTALATVMIQIWDKNGKFICDKNGIGKDTKPMLYSYIGKRLKIKSIVSYSRKIYANPLVKALNEACKNL